MSGIDRLAGKVALVSGAARGIGAAAVEVLAGAGATVVAGDVLDDELEALVRRLGSGAVPGTVEACHLDVTQDAQWRAAVGRAERGHGGLDVLVNNAGVSGRPGVLDLEEELWSRVIAVNQTGPWLGMRAATPALRRRGGGSIVNMSSIYGIVGTTVSAAYHATKGAVRLLTKQAALELGPDRIRVNSVHPGYIETAMTENLPPERVRLLLEGSALHRSGMPREVATAVLFLASDESSFVTGTELVVDGGYTAG
ncbi:MAG: glucose 1-dehydrogenase [Candidatus Dormibacteraceae bacterium]